MVRPAVCRAVSCPAGIASCTWSRPMISPIFDQESHEVRARGLGPCGGFAAIAVVAAAGGLFSVLSYSVSRRRREFGLRAAFGASPGKPPGRVARRPRRRYERSGHRRTLRGRARQGARFTAVRRDAGGSPQLVARARADCRDDRGGLVGARPSGRRGGSAGAAPGGVAEAHRGSNPDPWTTCPRRFVAATAAGRRVMAAVSSHADKPARSRI